MHNIPHSEETKGKIKNLHKGKHFSPATEFKKGMIPQNKGTKGIMKSNSGSFRKGDKPKWTGKTRDNVSGKNHWNYKDGRTKEKGYKSICEHNRNARKRENGGSHTWEEWETLKAQYNWTCPCCKKSEPEITLTEDHIIPVSKGGSNNIENIQPLCGSCNSSKKTKIVIY
jgi:5-methylcytosine-specific restriction endonuclease McrA